MHAHKQPEVGYVQGIYSSLISIICGCMTGLIRVMCCRKDLTFKTTPVDFVANATIASSAQKVQHLTESIPTFINCTTSTGHDMDWRHAVKSSSKYYGTYPVYKNFIWYPSVSFTTSFLWFLLLMILFQFIPALMFDFVSFFMPGKRKSYVIINVTLLIQLS